jgi:hypothetical protein
MYDYRRTYFGIGKIVLAVEFADKKDRADLARPLNSYYWQLVNVIICLS